MRVLAVTNMHPTAEFPGRGVFIQEQINSLNAIGLSVRMLFVDRFREGPSAYYHMGPKFAEALRDFAPDVVHVMYGGVMAERIIKQHHFRPTLVTFHGSDLLGKIYPVGCEKSSLIMVFGVPSGPRKPLKASSWWHDTWCELCRARCPQRKSMSFPAALT